MRKLMKPAVLTMQTFNTVLSRIGMNDILLPHMLAGINVLTDCLMENLPEGGKAVSLSIKEVLAEHVTSVSVRIPVNKEKEE